MKKLCDILKQHREANRLSMSEVYRRSKKIAKDHRAIITQGYISRLESGQENNPSFLKLLALCKIYGVTLNGLTGRWIVYKRIKP